ncbi:hypothetical protein D3C81_2017470 [compost metagenome]
MAAHELRQEAKPALHIRVTVLIKPAKNDQLARIDRNDGLQLALRERRGVDPGR